MNLVWAATGAVASVPVAAAARGAVYRMSVPDGHPDRTSCPGCAAPVRPWLAAPCGHCGHDFGAPGPLEYTMAVVLTLLLGIFGGSGEAVAFAFFGALGVALAVIDIDVQRLPDRLTLPAYPVLAALLAAAAVAGHEPGDLIRALLGALALGGCYLLLALARPGHLGGGDIKLAGLAGLVLGWLGWPVLLVGACLGFLLMAVFSLTMLAAGRITLRSYVSFGPFLVSGALLAMVASAV